MLFQDKLLSLSLDFFFFIYIFYQVLLHLLA